MDAIFLFLTYSMLGLSGLLFIISLASWYNLRTKNLIFASIAIFAIFFKTLLQILNIFSQNEIAITLDFIVVIFLYFSVIKK